MRTASYMLVLLFVPFSQLAQADCLETKQVLLWTKLQVASACEIKIPFQKTQFSDGVSVWQGQIDLEVYKNLAFQVTTYDTCKNEVVETHKKASQKHGVFQFTLDPMQAQQASGVAWDTDQAGQAWSDLQEDCTSNLNAINDSAAGN